MNEDIAHLRQHFHYDAETGKLYKLVGHECAGGYQRISFNGRLFQAHRLAWAIAHGKWPEDLIDHINGDRSDNRLSNLRDVSARVNLQNERKARKNSRSGLLGASWSKVTKRWAARIHYDGKHRHLGYFDTPQEAHAAYLAAKRLFHTGNTI